MVKAALRLGWRDLRASGRALWVFCACLMLGVALIAASGGLFQQASSSLLADARNLFGGDLEVRDRTPLSTEELQWIAARGDVSLLVELRTMMMTADGGLQLVEMQSVDDRYPLYGTVALRPNGPIQTAIDRRDGKWGVAIDPVLGERLGLEVGDEVILGNVTATVRALIQRQPDRSLRADWRGPPVIVAAEMLLGPGLVHPGADWEVRTFAERNTRLAKVLGQVASGVLLIGFSALFIGGVGVSNSVHAYLRGKRTTITTLQALGMRARPLAGVYLGQILMLAAVVSLIGALVGAGLALGGTALVPERVALGPRFGGLLQPIAVAWLFGVLTALGFSLPALGRALSVPPAVLFRGVGGRPGHVPSVYGWLTTGCATLVAVLILVVMPDPLFGLGFLVTTLILLGLLDALVRVVRIGARRLMSHRRLTRRFELRLALANLSRPDSALRVSLLSLGTALTLLVASALVVGAILRTLNETIPDNAPALVLYDISANQVETIRALVGEENTLERLDLAPLVLGRLAKVNDEALRESGDSVRVNEAHDEHKLSHRLDNIDRVIVDRGAWWPEGYRGPPQVAMEDYEADQLGLRVGDRLRFEVMGQEVEADLVAIYSQRRWQTRFWFEAIFSDGVLEPFITRYVGTAYLDPSQAAGVQNRIAAAAPNVVTVRTQKILDEVRTLLVRASAALGGIASVSLAVSLLVLVSVVAASRVRHLYDATVLHTLGARVGAIRRALQLEYALLALLTSIFAVTLGSGIALVLLGYRLQLESELIWWLGVLTAVAVSGTSLTLGAWYLLRHLRLSPALLLRTSE